MHQHALEMLLQMDGGGLQVSKPRQQAAILLHPIGD
jgi:hypothetical protein